MVRSWRHSRIDPIRDCSTKPCPGVSDSSVKSLKSIGKMPPKLIQLRNIGTPGSKEIDAMSRTPFGADIWSTGAISFEIPSNEMIQAQTLSGLAANVLSNVSVVLTTSPLRLSQQYVRTM
jgi:hypothetical protein